MGPANKTESFSTKFPFLSSYNISKRKTKYKARKKFKIIKMLLEN